ncbi:D-glycero-beta-D-manno-heptose 1-phosphate adenylyltransferase [Membranicola marinus]|uniref:D-glycero-beta-D-manno-heptose 1-phosphate adenylyltransferase n=1 Tax=Membranihabitans marinus TaxID=1227546 RepID=A0A953HUN2_9BACT|nr:D-glycero-beta-D-manno-heptose 1-phosphate adenylyltransferase [Membranihabitans marinus]MBY5958521.1 D-glycero-beta-D-manno-heptose 1-phosphate adenylyltransferase [Membranihabitans marinus]
MTTDFVAKKLIHSSELHALSDQREEKLIWTNGCFDIIHAGHITYLYGCKMLGGRLIVGLNSDASVRRLKGVNRPVNSVEERILHLASFFFVDYVFVYEEDTPLKWIEIIKPDLLVKGGDYKVEDIVGYHEVVRYGGQVTTIPLVEGKSTTSLIEKIRANHD